MLVKFEVRNFNCIRTISIYNAQKYRGTLPLVRPLFEKICPDCPRERVSQI